MDISVQSLLHITHLIIDMDGVLYHGDRPMPGLDTFMEFLRDKQIKFVLATNNSTQTPQEYVDKLAGMNVSISPKEILTSGQAAARYLACEYLDGTRVHVFGSPALKQALVDQGFRLGDEAVEIVVASMDRKVTYEKLNRATLLIREGARFIATNLDPTVPSEDGLLPGTGSLVAALETASGVKAQVIGKPEPTMYQLAIQEMDASPATTAVIGDRADTDILGGKQAGLMTICVLSGASNREDAEAIQADWIFDDISHLLANWN